MKKNNDRITELNADELEAVQGGKGNSTSPKSGSGKDSIILLEEQETILKSRDKSIKDGIVLFEEQGSI